jgi:uncharacterized coiled-coil DUF342 family protein
MKHKEMDFFNLPEELDAKSYQILVQEMINKGESGFDYLKFRQSVNALLQLQMDENTAIKSAFATASTIGLSRQTLEATARKSLSILSEEKKQFSLALDKQIRDRIDARTREVEQWRQQIQKHEAQIAALKQEMEAYNQRIESTSSDLTEAEERIQQSREKFETVYAYLQSQIEQDIAKFQQVLS